MTGRFLGIAGFIIAFGLFGWVDFANWARLGNQFTPFSCAKEISAQTYDESCLYAPGSRKYLDHLRCFWELDVYELRDERFSYPTAHLVIFGLLGHCFGDLQTAWVIGHAALPAGIWLMMYLLARHATGNAWLAWGGAWVACVVAAGPRNSFGVGIGSWSQPLEMTRLPHPGLSTLVLLGSVLAQIHVARTGRSAWAIVAGALMGLLFYTYYFHWLAAWSAWGLWVLVAWASDRPLIKPLAIMAGVGLPVGVPYLGWTLQSMISHNSAPLLARLGEYTRWPDWLALALLPIFGWLAWRSRKIRGESGGLGTRDALFIVSVLMAGACIVANFHLVSGYNAQHEHAYNRIIQPFGVVLLAGLLAQWPAAAELLRQVAARRVFAAAGVVVICAAGVRQSCVADSVLPFHDRSHCANRLAFDLATNLEDEQVVAILDEPARALLPTVTKHWSFVPIGFRTIADNREVLTRFVITAKLGSVSEADALALLRSPSPGPYLRSYAYGLLDDAELSPAAEALFHQLWQTVSLEAALASRRLDLVVLPEEAQPAKVSGMDIVPVRSFGSWTVYRLQRA